MNQSYIGLRPDLIKYITEKNVNILDVGCATGTNGKYLIENNIAKEVCGIEYDINMAKLAEAHYAKVYCGNLNSIEFVNTLNIKEKSIDYILFGDILEHLINPDILLLDFNKFLKPKGKIIISVPNISHLELFIQVYIKGSWPQNERGIFDKTHLRWFTKKDIINLIESSGFKTIDYERKYRSRDSIGSKFNYFYKLIKLLNKDLVTFQHILVGEKR